jgi:membrane-associated protease RseP (regulator of RpoE activity)
MFPPEKEGNPTNWFTRWVSDARKNQRSIDGEYDESKAFYKLSVPKRIVVMLGGPTMNLILGIVLTVWALCGIGTVQNTTTVSQVFPCVPANYSAVTCTDTDPVSPAKLAGLKAGDKILTLNGETVSNWNQARKTLDAAGENPVALKIQRGSETLSVSVTPMIRKVTLFDEETGSMLKDSAGNPINGNRAVLGIALKGEVAPMSFVGAAKTIGYELTQTGAMILQLPQQVSHLAGNLFSGAPRDQNGPVSIVGIGGIAGEVATSNSIDWTGKLFTGLMLLGSLNFALFVFNIVPLLPLDGGHVLNAIYEGLKRNGYKLLGKADPGPVDTARMVPFTTAMWGLLMILSLLIITADLISPVKLG